MLSSNNIKRWLWVHRWTSLICTLFLLMLCITGLPLIFRDEIDEWLSKDPPYVTLPKETPLTNLDGLVRVAKARYPGQLINFLFIDDDEPQVVVNMQPGTGFNPKVMHALHFDARTAKLLKDEPPQSQQSPTFTGVLLNLHADLFLDLPGELFLGFMGLLFVIAIVSGFFLYGPFMRKLDFGTIRRARSRRLKWLDLHNLLGIVTGVWLLVVGFTGFLNELSTPLFGLWQQTDVKKILAQYQGKPTPGAGEIGAVQEAYELAKKTLPGMEVTSVVFPGYKFGSPYHYLLWTKGNTPLTARLFSPVLVDARTGRLDVVVKMPWYLRSVEVSRPLHFGDYGGMPLKVLWALFDLAGIVVLISGVYLWFARRKMQKDYFSQPALDSGY